MLIVFRKAGGAAWRVARHAVVCRALKVGSRNIRRQLTFLRLCQRRGYGGRQGSHTKEETQKAHETPFNHKHGVTSPHSLIAAMGTAENVPPGSRALPDCYCEANIARATTVWAIVSLSSASGQRVCATLPGTSGTVSLREVEEDENDDSLFCHWPLLAHLSLVLAYTRGIPRDDVSLVILLRHMFTVGNRRRGRKSKTLER